jgi:hypothetical protein
MNKQLSADSRILDEECDAFCSYLVGRPADEYIRKRYREAHERTELVPQNRDDTFDSFIIRFAQKGAFCTRLADVYTRWFFRRSALRAKLLLLMATLECSASTHTFFEAAASRSKIRFWLIVFFQGVRWISCLIVSFVFFSVSYLLISCLNVTKGVSRV